MTRGLRRSMVLLLALSTLVGCQAPGFMGMSGSTSSDGTLDEHRVARASFRVLVPASMAQGLSLAPAEGEEATASLLRLDDRAVVGARVFLEAQPSVQDTTDSSGIASLAVPVGRLTPVRAEFKTSEGLVSMTALIQLAPDAAQAAFPITVASTLVTTKIAQRFRYADLTYLDAGEIARATEEVDRAIRAPSGDYDPRFMPQLVRQWSVLELAQSVAVLDPILEQALVKVLATRIPTPAPAAIATDSWSVATLSATASPLATVSLPATASLLATASLVGDASLFPMTPGSRRSFDLLDEDGQVAGHMEREVLHVLPRPGGALLQGVEHGDGAEGVRDARFLIRRAGQAIQVAAAFRPSVCYPLPLTDGKKWQAAPGIEAIAHAPTASCQPEAPGLGAWQVDFTRRAAGATTRWSEWLAPHVGFVRLQWVDLRDGVRHEAALHLEASASAAP